MFNVLLRRTRVPRIAPQVSRYRYASTSTFVPPESLNDLNDRPPPTRGGRFADNEAKDRPKPRPESPTFYTGASPFFDQLIELEDIVSTTRQALKTMQLYPLPKFAREALPPYEPVWKDKVQMADMLGAAVSTARHRRIVSTLNTLEEYKRIAETAGVEHLAMNIAEILESFEKENKEAVLERGKRKPVQFDQYGRTYTVGRRKESSARVWVIPVQQPPTPEAAAPQNPKLEELAPFLPQSLVPSEAPAAPIEITTTNIIINNTPLNEYFAAPTDRERVIRPLKVAGVLGAFNVFAIARGGGTTGQSGAVSQGIAKAIAAHVPDMQQVLRKAKLTRRDPRMVERKKTGLAKAREAYAWVKR